MGALTPWHLVLILIGFVLLFGYRKLPDASRSLGRSLRIFKSEVGEMADASAAAPEAMQTERPPVSPPPVHGSIADLEAEATAAEARAAELRERVNARGEGPPSAV